MQSKVCSLFGYFANFIHKFEPNTWCKSHGVDMEGRFRENGYVVDKFGCLFGGMPRVQVLLKTVRRL